MARLRVMTARPATINLNLVPITVYFVRPVSNVKFRVIALMMHQKNVPKVHIHILVP